MTVRLLDGWVTVDTDPAKSVRPAAYFTEISHVGFKPVAMELRATGEFAAGAFVVDGGRWPLVGEAPAGSGPRAARFKVADGTEDPPHVTSIPDVPR